MRSAGSRFLIVGILALLMFIPLFFVGAVIDGRADYSRDAISDVGREWGGQQSISGPVMAIPVEGPVTRTERRDVRNPSTGQIEQETYEVTEIRRKAAVYVYPNQFDLQIASTTELRHRGIFNVPVYTSEAIAVFDFNLPDPGDVLEQGEVMLWDQATLRVSVTSNRALRGVAKLTADGRDAPLEPITAQNARAGGVEAALGDPRGVESYRLQLGFNGAEQLFAAPVGRDSRITMSSDWPHPSFTGAFLPDSHEITKDGFTARWTIPHLARALPQVSRQDYDGTARNETAFGVRFFQPNDFYQKAYRAARYGILFIALTFLTVLLIEDKTRKPTHPVQYILIGLAQSVFVLLMLAYAEQIGFGWAYLLSSAATIGLLVLFGYTALKLEKRVAVLGALLVLLYSVLYLILRSADYALLAGATLAFVAIGGTMILTRDEDWYGQPKRPENKKGGWGLWGQKPPVRPEGPSPEDQQ